ncbi:TMV resistance protein N-like [Dorcoceras hygrometricum]|uniref:TMV resistance protein N-like n=1 Tax=Dorcoceras hygrometricum TaxID=472368 RepID=A0A2Z7AMY8_9LAMI|nr:TMV resistance protein N-like [Dorcoceras hygrometricum]
MVKRLATSPHDPLGITDSACKNQLLGIRIRTPAGSGRTINFNRDAINTNNNNQCINIHRVFQACYLAGTCAWLQPVFQEPGASRFAVVTSIRSMTRFETPSSDCTRSPDEISTIGFSSKTRPEQIPAKLAAAGGGARRAAAAALGEERWGG